MSARLYISDLAPVSNETGIPTTSRYRRQQAWYTNGLMMAATSVQTLVYRLPTNLPSRVLENVVCQQLQHPTGLPGEQFPRSFAAAGTSQTS